MRKYLSPSDILYIEGDGNYSVLKLSNGQVERRSYTLKWFQTQYRGFIRISKHVLINPDYIENWGTLPTRQLGVTVVKGPSMAVAARRIGQVTRQLKRVFMKPVYGKP